MKQLNFKAYCSGRISDQDADTGIYILAFNSYFKKQIKEKQAFFSELSSQYSGMDWRSFIRIIEMTLSINQYALIDENDPEYQQVLAEKVQSNKVNNS